MTSISCAIFPLPQMVAFPGRTIPLHIFEPRYRKMIAYCLEHSLPLGVALADKLIAKRERPYNMSQVLKEDQSVYSPHQIFCVGEIVVKEVTEDGRILIDLKVRAKVRLKGLTQELPFFIGEVEPLFDEVDNPLFAERYYDLLLKISLSLLSEKYAHILDDFIAPKEKNLEALVYHTTSWLYFAAQDCQEILEEPMVEGKAQLLLQKILREYFNKNDELTGTANDNVIYFESFLGPRQ